LGFKAPGLVKRSGISGIETSLRGFSTATGFEGKSIGENRELRRSKPFCRPESDLAW